MRFGTVALVGRPNVGKSTFLNAAVGQELAIVSPVPQTSRDALLGVAQRSDAQIAFVDTPGVHRPRSELGKRMNSAALSSLRQTDVVVMMTDVYGLGDRQRRVAAREGRAQVVAMEGSQLNEPTLLHPGDSQLIELLPQGTRCLLAINKVDTLRNKPLLLPLSEAFGARYPFESVIPMCAHRTADVERLLSALVEHLPEGPVGYAADDLTNRPVLFFLREYVREQVLLRAQSEVPHATAVTIDAFEQDPALTRVAATIHVEKQGQRKILVGKGGSSIREIGQAARLRMEELLGGRVFLELFVRITPRWRNAPRQLAELGYERGEPGTADAIAAAPKRKIKR